MDPKKIAEIKEYVDELVESMNNRAMLEYARLLRRMQVRNISVTRLYFYP